MNRTFGYARVSTLDQNLDTQLDALQRAGRDEIFQDKITGMSTSRPALDDLQARLRIGDTVMVARFFRLGRSRDHLIHPLSEVCGRKALSSCRQCSIFREHLPAIRTSERATTEPDSIMPFKGYTILSPLKTSDRLFL